MKSDLHELTLQLHHETERAILVSDDGEANNAVWLAKSQVEYRMLNDKDRMIEVTIPEWLAVERGLF